MNLNPGISPVTGNVDNEFSSGAAGVGDVGLERAFRQLRVGMNDGLGGGLRDLLAAYRSTGSIDGKKMLISQICLELRARHQQREQMFYGSVREILTATERR